MGPKYELRDLEHFMALSGFHVYFSIFGNGKKMHLEFY